MNTYDHLTSYNIKKYLDVIIQSLNSAKNFHKFNDIDKYKSLIDKSIKTLEDLINYLPNNDEKFKVFIDLSINIINNAVENDDMTLINDLIVKYTKLSYTFMPQEDKLCVVNLQKDLVQ